MNVTQKARCQLLLRTSKSPFPLLSVRERSGCRKWLLEICPLNVCAASSVAEHSCEEGEEHSQNSRPGGKLRTSQVSCVPCWVYNKAYFPVAGSKCSPPPPQRCVPRAFLGLGMQVRCPQPPLKPGSPQLVTSLPFGCLEIHEISSLPLQKSQSRYDDERR